MNIDTTDPARLEAALEALPLGAAVLVTAGGASHTIHRVPGGWWLDGDLTVASGDVADGRPAEVEVVDPFGDDPVPGGREWADAGHDEFFRRVPASAYLASTDPDDQGLTGLVLVDEALRAGRPGPPDGLYVVRWDAEGRVAAERWGR